MKFRLNIVCLLMIPALSLYPEDTLSWKRINISVLAGPALTFDDGGGLCGHAGFRLHTDLTDMYFISLEHRFFSSSTGNGETMIIAEQTFEPARFVNYTYGTQYSSSSFAFGGYLIGYGSDQINLYMSAGVSRQNAFHRFSTEEYDRDKYEDFPKAFNSRFTLWSGFATIGYNSLISKHFGWFAEAQLNLVLAGNRPVIPDQLYQTPGGHYLALNFGMRFYPFTREAELY